jgi:hypothetical protein
MTFKFQSQPDRDSGRVIIKVFAGERDRALLFAGHLTLTTKAWQTFVHGMTAQDALHVLIDSHLDFADSAEPANSHLTVVRTRE